MLAFNRHFNREYVRTYFKKVALLSFSMDSLASNLASSSLNTLVKTLFNNLGDFRFHKNVTAVCYVTILPSYGNELLAYGV